MPFSIFVIYITLTGAFLLWAYKNEEKLISFEQRIISNIKKSRRDAKRRKNIKVVRNSTSDKSSSRGNASYKGFVA